jgi:hypothetical protein
VSAVRLVPGFGLVLLLVCALCAGQSLVDAARKSRQQKETRGTTAKKVYTTDDMADPAPALAQEPGGLSGTWSFTHFDDRFQGYGLHARRVAKRPSTSKAPTALLPLLPLRLLPGGANQFPGGSCTR